MTSDQATAAPRVSAEREDYYNRIGEKRMRPLWELLRGIVPKEPRTKAVPALWRMSDYMPALLEAGRIIAAEEAERRVLVLENPGLEGQIRITQSLYAGVQIVLPSERAPSHRHTQTALRFVIQGDGAYTDVEGQKIQTAPGDLVITPNWAWHEHANESRDPVIWVDGLDVPIVTLLDTGFAEEHPKRRGRSSEEKEPVKHRTWHFPFAAMRHQLEAIRAMGPADPCHGWRVRYRDPDDGMDPMPTMVAFLQLMQRGFASRDYRSTDGTICVVVSGAGETAVGEDLLSWSPGDVFVLPAWKRYRHTVRDEAVIFSFSDRPVQEKLSLWREDRLP